MHHRAIGTAIISVGGFVVVLGLAIMAVLGPDGRFTTGPHVIDTDGVAIVTAPTVVSWKNVRVEVLAEVPANKPVFVGLANSVDVQAYLKGVKRLEVTKFSTPWHLKTREIDGSDALPGAPTAVDWWQAHAAGLGGAAIKTELPDDTVSLAILSVGSSNLRGLKVTLAYGLKGGFFKGLGLLLAGAGLIWAGILARRGESIWDLDSADSDDLTSWPGDESPTEVIPRLGPSSGKAAGKTGGKSGGATAAPVVHAVHVDHGAHIDLGTEHEEHEVVYVYVDEDGVEHELSAEEAAQYEVVDVEHLVESEPEPEPEPGPEVAPKPDVAPEPESAAAPKSDDEPVTYFWIDENGVEHEVSEDELHEFELLDEDES